MVKPQIPFASGAIRTMTRVTVLGKNGPYITIEIDQRQRVCGRGVERQRQRGARPQHSASPINPDDGWPEQFTETITHGSALLRLRFRGPEHRIFEELLVGRMAVGDGVMPKRNGDDASLGMFHHKNLREGFIFTF